MTEEKGETESSSQKCQPMYVTFAALVASIGGILFGYDIGITSGALLQLRVEFNLSCFEQEMVVSAVLIGAFCASFFGGNIVDTWGRKAGIALSSCLFITGALILSFSFNFIMLIFGRLIVGIAVSISVTSECTYLSEISPPSRRGMMVSLNEVAITVGFLLAYLVNFLFITTHNGWKYMFGVAAIPAFLQALGIALMPNSHHYLIVKGKKDKARKVLRSLRNKNDVEEEMEAIISSIEEQKSCRYVDLFSSSSNMRGRMVLGMTLVSLQQFSGNTNVLYYAPTVFQHFGYDSDSLATLVTVGLGIVKVLSTAVTLLIVDKVGRRSLLLIGCLLMATSITLLGIFGTFQGAYSSTDGCTSPAVYSNTSSQTPRNIKPLVLSRSYVFPKTNDAKIITENTKILFIKNKSSVPESLKDFQDNIFFENFQFSEINNKSLYIVKLSKNETLLKNGTLPVNRHEKHRMLTVTNNSEDYLDSATQQVDIGPSLPIKIISVTSLMIFICAYGMSYGPVTWLVLSEIFPGSLRGRAVSVATCINWGSNIVVSLTFLDILNVAGIGPTFVVYGFVCYAAAVFVFFCVPETKSKTLEEINKDLSKGFLQKDIKACVFPYSHRKYSLKTFASESKTSGVKHEAKSYKYLNENSLDFFM